MDSNGRGVVEQLARTWRAIGVNESPLLADFRPEDRVWWRFILGMITGLVGGVILAVILAFVVAIPIVVAMVASGHDIQAMQRFLLRIQEPDFEPTYSVALGMIWGLAITNGVMLVGFVWIGSLLVRKPLKLSFTTARRWRWRQLLGGLVLYGAVLGCMEGFEVLFLGQHASLPILKISQSPAMILLFLVLSVPGWVIAAGVEEVSFRGWLLRQSAVLLRWTWLYILLNGLLFSFIHWDFKPADFDLNAFIARAAMGWGFCYMALRMGGIEFSTGAHTANNLLLVIFIEPFNLASPPAMPFDPGGLVESTVMLVMLIGVTEVAIRVPFIARLVGPPAAGRADEAEAVLS